MYEKNNGPMRLSYTLYNISGDKSIMALLSHVMNYHPIQLKEDIQALYDYIKESERN